MDLTAIDFDARKAVQTALAAGGAIGARVWLARQRNTLKNIEKQLDELISAFDVELLEETFPEMGVASAKTADGAVVYMHRQGWAKVLRMDNAKKALALEQADDLVKETINTHTLSKYVRDNYADNKGIVTLPKEWEGAIEYSEKIGIRVRGAGISNESE